MSFKIFAAVAASTCGVVSALQPRHGRSRYAQNWRHQVNNLRQAQRLQNQGRRAIQRHQRNLAKYRQQANRRYQKPSSQSRPFRVEDLPEAPTHLPIIWPTVPDHSLPGQPPNEKERAWFAFWALLLKTLSAEQIQSAEPFGKLDASFFPDTWGYCSVKFNRIRAKVLDPKFQNEDHRVKNTMMKLWEDRLTALLGRVSVDDLVHMLRPTDKYKDRFSLPYLKDEKYHKVMSIFSKILVPIYRTGIDSKQSTGYSKRDYANKVSLFAGFVKHGWGPVVRRAESFLLQWSIDFKKKYDLAVAKLERQINSDSQLFGAVPSIKRRHSGAGRLQSTKNNLQPPAPRRVHSAPATAKQRKQRLAVRKAVATGLLKVPNAWRKGITTHSAAQIAKRVEDKEADLFATFIREGQPVENVAQVLKNLAVRVGGLSLSKYEDNMLGAGLKLGLRQQHSILSSPAA